jgi:hypothetical protein
MAFGKVSVRNIFVSSVNCAIESESFGIAKISELLPRRFLPGLRARGFRGLCPVRPPGPSALAVVQPARIAGID